ncbi:MULTISPECIES: NAD(P)/FAD-dependent oxidoreductase [unclassified Microbacterium]|uniref:NAD(P)/FAD-dependent oxidoreductase n=1 Tax=unclassified Microbacterium TaxID=2609290 RepID=UPI0022F0D3B2|nr:NAD(P)/FAD-dependent oxidoreductase [Streptomyces sp. MS2A]
MRSGIPRSRPGSGEAAEPVADAGTGALAEPYDALIIGGGPAGLSAALGLGRSRSRVLVVDADRPRNAATLNSHGFLTRDGMPPHELRRLAREELGAYPDVEILSRRRVLSLRRTTDPHAPFEAEVGRREPESRVRAQTVLLATGLRETLPEVPGLLGCYGVSVFSCAACDGWELQQRRLALFGRTPDLAVRARLIARWTDDLTVFTHGEDVLDAVQEAELAAIGVVVERRRVLDLVSEKGRIVHAVVEGGAVLPLDGGFVRPEWSLDLAFLDGIDPDRDAAGHLVTDRVGRTSIPGLYAAGDAASPGPQQLIIAAGAGARAATAMVHDAVGVSTPH